MKDLQFIPCSIRRIFHSTAAEHEQQKPHFRNKYIYIPLRAHPPQRAMASVNEWMNEMSSPLTPSLLPPAPHNKFRKWKEEEEEEECVINHSPFHNTGKLYLNRKCRFKLNELKASGGVACALYKQRKQGDLGEWKWTASETRDLSLWRRKREGLKGNYPGV